MKKEQKRPVSVTGGLAAAKPWRRRASLRTGLWRSLCNAVTPRGRLPSSPLPHCVEPGRTQSNQKCRLTLSTLNYPLSTRLAIPTHSNLFKGGMPPPRSRLWTVDCGLWTVAGLFAHRTQSNPVEPKNCTAWNLDLGTFPADRCYRIVIGRVLSFPIHRINGHLHF